MRCRQDDMAIVIDTPPYPDCKPRTLADALRRQCLGQVVRCVALRGDQGRGPIWAIEKSIRVHYDDSLFGNLWVDVWGIPDCDLQPIRGQALKAGAPEQLPEVVS